MNESGVMTESGVITESAGTRGWGRFAAVWIPQTLALTGRGLTTFALGVWVYQRTHSATLFALLQVIAILPSIVAAPSAISSARRAPSRSTAQPISGAATIDGRIAITWSSANSVAECVR